MPEFVTKYWTEWIFGIVSAILLALYRSLAAKVKKERDEQAALKAGMQALLRAQMVNDYNRYSEKGYAPIYARESFENLWQQYEALGKNNVMSDLHDKFFALPTK